MKGTLKIYSSFEEMKSDEISENISDEEKEKRHKNLKEFIKELQSENKTGDTTKIQK